MGSALARHGHLAMSMSTTPTERECPECGYTGADAHSHHSFCSEDCEARHNGRKLLKLIVKDHRWCSGCFTQLKNVRKSRPSDPDCFIGYQFLSGDTLKGEKHVTLPGLQSESERLIDAHGTICANCGTTSHSDSYVRDEGLLDDDPTTVANRLLNAVRQTRREGQHEKFVDVDVFKGAWCERPGEWAYCLGRSLHE